MSHTCTTTPPPTPTQDGTRLGWIVVAPPKNTLVLGPALSEDGLQPPAPSVSHIDKRAHLIQLQLHFLPSHLHLHLLYPWCIGFYRSLLDEIIYLYVLIASSLINPYIPSLHRLRSTSMTLAC
jgi:hypothetical protein